MPKADELGTVIVHERFTEYGGSEKVVEELHRIWPDAPILTTVCDYNVLPRSIPRNLIRTSKLQRLYRGGGSYAHLLPLLPAALALMSEGAHTVISSHHAFANQVRAGRHATRFVSYTHTPARWMWDPAMLTGEPGGRIGHTALRAFGATYRASDHAAAQRPEVIVANSSAVQRRIATWWGRDSQVIHPPVDTEFYHPNADIAREDFFLLAGRLVPYKQPDVAVAAATRLGAKLVVVGAGRSDALLRSMAGPTVEFRGRVPDEELRSLYQRCAAFLQPGVEDFGISVVEAQACGAPVIARAEGGALDTVHDGVTGHLYPVDRSTGPVTALANVLTDFVPSKLDSATIVAHAQRFGRAQFVNQMRATVDGL